MSLAEHSPLSSILPATFKTRISEWLSDDMPSFDVQGCIAGLSAASFDLLCKSDHVVVAGFPFFSAVFEFLGCSVAYRVQEGSVCSKGQIIASVHGPAAHILRGERTGLELIVRSSSLATRAKAFSDYVLNNHPQFAGRIAGTRKTTPGLRLVEKYALLVAGVDTHRLDLSQMVMLKDNHIDVVGSIPRAVEQAKRLAGFATKIEVECRKVEDAFEALEAGADIVMLDNFAGEQARVAALQIKDRFPKAIVEVSGGIRTVEDLDRYAFPNIDVISMGTLTQAVYPVDFSLKFHRA
eukprot:ANDGO_00559.mRNA.1 Nicotinate-nucleotide pyrophosphorylase